MVKIVIEYDAYSKEGGGAVAPRTLSYPVLMSCSNYRGRQQRFYLPSILCGFEIGSRIFLLKVDSDPDPFPLFFLFNCQHGIAAFVVKYDA